MATKTDWIAAHDQATAEVENVLKRRRRFLMLWIEDEDDDLTPQTVASTGLFKPGDDAHFLQHLLHRLANPEEGAIGAGPRPGDPT